MNHLILVFVLVFLLACNNANEQNKMDEPVQKSIDIEKELAAIEQVRANFSLALKEGRYEDLGQWVTPDAKTVRPGGSDWDKMFALGKERGRFPYDSIMMIPTETYIMNDTMAYDWGTSRVYYTDEGGNKIELKDAFLVIMKKDKGEWKLHREVGSSFVK